MKDFDKFFADNKASIIAFAKSNTKFNSKGHATISPKDDWFFDDVWDSSYKELSKSGKRSHTVTVN